MACWKILTFVGLFLNLVGVVLLFLYVLPRRERTEGIRITWINPDKPNQELIRLERRWDTFSLDRTRVRHYRHCAPRARRLAFALETSLEPTAPESRCRAGEFATAGRLIAGHIAHFGLKNGITIG